MRRPPGPAVTAALAVAFAVVVGACAGTNSSQVEAGGSSKGTVTSSTLRRSTTTAPTDCAALLPPEGQAAQLVMAEVADPAQVGTSLSEGTVGGMLLEGNQRSDLADRIGTAVDGAPLTPLVAVSEEGGQNQSLKYSVGALPSQGQLATVSPKEAAAVVGDHAAKMAAIGVNANMAPLVAVAGVGSGSGAGSGTGSTAASSTTATARGAGATSTTFPSSKASVRTFGSNPTTVAGYVEATTAAMAKAEVVPVLKYWPGGTGAATGAGSSSGGTAKGTLTKLAPLDQLRGTDLAVFDAVLADSAVPAVMVANAEVPGLTAAGEPASLSRPAITGELRGKEGFDGVVMTETLGTGAVAKVAPVDEAAERAIAAGADVAVVAGIESATAARARLADAISTGRLDAAAVVASVRRVLKLKGVTDECYDAVSAYAAQARKESEASSTTTTTDGTDTGTGTGKGTGTGTTAGTGSPSSAGAGRTTTTG